MKWNGSEYVSTAESPPRWFFQALLGFVLAATVFATVVTLHERMEIAFAVPCEAQANLKCRTCNGTGEHWVTEGRGGKEYLDLDACPRCPQGVDQAARPVKCQSCRDHGWVWESVSGHKGAHRQIACPECRLVFTTFEPPIRGWKVALGRVEVCSFSNPFCRFPVAVYVGGDGVFAVVSDGPHRYATVRLGGETYYWDFGPVPEARWPL